MGAFGQRSYEHLYRRSPMPHTQSNHLTAYTQGCEDAVAGVFDGYEVNSTFT
jgi:hypothetical protein